MFKSSILKVQVACDAAITAIGDLVNYLFTDAF